LINRKGLFKRVSKGAGLFLFKRLTENYGSQSFPAEWAETKARFRGAAAGGAGAAVTSGVLSQGISGFAGDAATAPASQKRGPLFDSKQGDKKQRNTVIHPFEACLIQTARLAHPGRVIQGHGPWLYSSDEEEHGFLPCVKDGLHGYDK